MKTKGSLRLAALGLCLMAAAAGADRRPNIVLIVADDLGYADVGFQGVQDIPTPSLDALAARGVRLTNGYVSGTWCSPTRAGLMTGRYQQRFGPGGHEEAERHGLLLDEVTLADRLAAAGYATGLVGKWHLGVDPDYHPLERGFQEFFGFLPGGHNFLPGLPIVIFPDHEGNGDDLGEQSQEVRENLDGNIRRGREKVPEPDYLTDAFGREAVSFIQRHEKEPFFLYLSFNAVHTPMQADDGRFEKFAHIDHPVRRIYNAMMVAMDDAIGAVMDQLKRSKISDNTIVFFINDNGGPTVHRFAYNASDNTPLRGSKGTTLEAGIRVPFVVSWPAVLPQGQDYDQPVISLDILPTVLAAAGVAGADGAKYDGVNLIPHLSGTTETAPHDVLYWRSRGQMAVRQGDWKLVSYVAKMDEGEIMRGEPLDVMTPHRLYNLRDDIGEARDLAKQEPKRVARMLALWNRWNAEMPPAAE